MSKSSSKNEPPFELKHRVTGAIILVLIAVLVIPLMLSEPALEASNQAGDGSKTTNKTFRSRIVPLNIDNINGVANTSSGLSDTNTTVLSDNKPALLDLTNSQGTNLSASEESNSVTATQTTAVVMTQQPDANQVIESSATPSSAQDSKTTINLPEEQNQQGWVVRVGTFSKDANVESVSTLLTNSGFKPRKTAVSTSLGSSTRVWLGPYAKKQTAEKISDRLKSLIGEKGYVTRTNS